MRGVFALAQHGQREVNYITQRCGEDALQLCLGVGAVFALPECVRAAVGTTGHSIAGGQCELIQASSSEVRSGQ